MNELIYDKKYHYIDSISEWLDIDTILYLIVIILIAYKTMHIIKSLKKKECISLFTFVKKYSLICTLPLFLLYAAQLVISNMYIYKNIVTTILPILYALIVQIIFYVIDKIKNKKEK